MPARGPPCRVRGETTRVAPLPQEMTMSLSRPLVRPAKDERGMTTAEYAVGTVATVTFAGVLLKIFTDPDLQDLLWNIILWIIKLITGFGG